MEKDYPQINIKIKKLTPELTEDYLHFFDVTPHSTNKAEHRCYCVCWAGENCDDRDFSSAEKRRIIADEYVRNSRIQGYLAYFNGKVIGWCNANTKVDCYECVSWKRFMQPIKRDEPDIKVKSVFCFAISPDMRGKGVATMLLRRVCEDAETDGFDFIEAYPNKEFVSTEDDFMGTAGMYEKAGFTVFYETGDKTVMRKTLNR